MGAVSAVLLALTYLLAVRTARGQRLDDRGFQLLYAVVPGGLVQDVLTWLARPAEIVLLAVVVLVLATAALGRGDRWAVVASVATVGISLGTTLVLRDDILSRPYLMPDAFPVNSLPSMHASAAVSLGAAVLLLWPGRPDRWPWWLPAGVGLAVVISAVGNVVSQAHRLSDVVASVFLVTTVAAVAAAALALRSVRRADSDPPSSSDR